MSTRIKVYIYNIHQTILAIYNAIAARQFRTHTYRYNTIWLYSTTYQVDTENKIKVDAVHIAMYLADYE